MTNGAEGGGGNFREEKGGKRSKVAPLQLFTACPKLRGRKKEDIHLEKKKKKKEKEREGASRE